MNFEHYVDEESFAYKITTLLCYMSRPKLYILSKLKRVYTSKEVSAEEQEQERERENRER